MSTTPAGWYPQPDGTQRYWDGDTWTEHLAPGTGSRGNPEAAGPGKPDSALASDRSRPWFKKKRFLIPGGLLAASVLFGAMGAAGDEPSNPGTAVETTSSPSSSVEESAAPVTQSATPTPEPTPSDTPEPAAAEVEGTVSQENALRSAETYIEFKGFSKKGLIDQLSSEYGEGFSKADAEWAVENLDVNWNEQAVRSGETYLEMKGFSRSGLIEQLSSEYGDQFTKKQATHAAEALGL